MEKERIGSTRRIYAVEPGVIAFEYTDGWSTFDRGTSPQTIPGIGEARCSCAVTSFRLAEVSGIPTHFVRQADECTIHVREFSVPGKPALSGRVHGRVIPLEWIYRLKAYGSLLERLRDGRMKPEALGFAPGTVVTEGMRLPESRVECTTKFEKMDRHLSDAEAAALAKLDWSQMETCRVRVTLGASVTSIGYARAGYEKPDGKEELLLASDGRILLGDVFGTPDEDRIFRKKDGELFCKDLIRKYLSGLPWKRELDAARAAFPNDKDKWPSYPRLPEELVALVSERYRALARDYEEANAG